MISKSSLASTALICTGTPRGPQRAAGGRQPEEERHQEPETRLQRGGKPLDWWLWLLRQKPYHLSRPRLDLVQLPTTIRLFCSTVFFPGWGEEGQLGLSSPRRASRMVSSESLRKTSRK